MGTGNTQSRHQSSDHCAVHPRGHGEHLVAPSVNDVALGSSPWARGTPTPFNAALVARRFIPVGTGNTYLFYGYRMSSPVHPRGHGEHFPTTQLNSYFSGSSPWARGTLWWIVVLVMEKRFIPVGTGNTISARWLRMDFSVHPRGHGEH